MDKTLAAALIILLAVNLAAVIFAIIKILGLGSSSDSNSIIERIKLNDSHQKEIYERLSRQQTALRTEVSNQDRQQREEITASMQSSFSTLSKMIVENLMNSNQTQSNQLLNLEERMKTLSIENEQKLTSIRHTVESRLDKIQDDNNRKLDEMRTIVTEKLNQTIDRRMTESFKTVNDRLEEVYKGLGEMQNLAVGVGDLKKVLSNVKSRGILGEIQLGAILREILSPEQYETNLAVKPNSRNVVEFAIKLPSNDGSVVYLPIDSKFPGDTYAALRDAYESGSPEQIDLAAKALIRTIRAEAKDIHDKYICPPHTTDFAIMFLPFEGLYSEVVNRGLIESLQKDFHINIAGPSTMAALLNSLQMGFKTLAVQKRSSEVWSLLNEISTEFNSFTAALETTQAKLKQTDNELEKLVGVRTRQMQRKLSKVTEYHD